MGPDVHHHLLDLRPLFGSVGVEQQGPYKTSKQRRSNTNDGTSYPKGLSQPCKPHALLIVGQCGTPQNSRTDAVTIHTHV